MITALEKGNVLRNRVRKANLAFNSFKDGVILMLSFFYFNARLMLFDHSCKTAGVSYMNKRKERSHPL